ncbi:MAG: hypothetical protein ACYS99_18875 [Planctomycetota bacterium]|jgi:hypothetical protein
MKTVEGVVRGVDDNLHFTGSAEERRLDRMSGDLWVAYMLSLPREFPPVEEGATPPTLELRGKSGMWLRLSRREPGDIFWLSMKDGEQDHRVAELQAAERVRLFVRYWGEETELTGEFRLPPEMLARIAQEEKAKDETRRRRFAKSSVRAVFGKRTSKLLPFKNYELIVDGVEGIISERRFGKPHEVLRLDDVREADVTGFRSGDPSGRDFRVVVALGEEKEKQEIGHGGWPMRKAILIAEAVNDAIDLSESRRKFLRYRREQPGKGRKG